MSKRLLMLGFDCAEPDLVFNRWLDDLPNISALKEQGISGKMKSIIPSTTCPSWMSMLTGQQPGKLGFYGLRNRVDYSYNNFVVADSMMVKVKTIWNRLDEVGKKSILIGVPQTYPAKSINGWQITGFLTPGINSEYTYPPELKKEIEALVGDYKFDIDNLRGEYRKHILEQIYEMTEKRFKVAKYLMSTKEWDLMIMVELGLDRIQHIFWHYFDPNHLNYPGKNQYQSIVKDYYIYLDKKIGELLEYINEDTAVMLVSNHGAKPMIGGICINEWLIQEGYLKLKDKPEKITSIQQLKVDWQNTIAWGYGGHYGQLYLNVAGREPSGVIPQVDYEVVRNELINKLKAITDENGENIGTKIYKPENLYGDCNNIPPDLIILFGNLDWRSIESVGHECITLYRNNSRIDSANHKQHGIYIFMSKNTEKRENERINLLDVVPTILDYFDLEIEDELAGRRIQ